MSDHKSFCKRLLFIFSFSLSFKRVGLLFVISGNSCSSFSAAFDLVSSYPSLSSFFFMPPTSYYSSSTPRPRSSAAALFHLRYSSTLVVPFSWKPMLLPSRLGADREEKRRRWDEKSTFFSTFLLYSDSTVRPLGANRWHAGEVEMLPT